MAGETDGRADAGLPESRGAAPEQLPRDPNRREQVVPDDFGQVSRSSSLESAPYDETGRPTNAQAAPHVGTGRTDEYPVMPQEPAAQATGERAAERRERRARHASSARPPYAHEPRRHRTQPPVNDVQADDAFEHHYSHDSSYTLSTHNPIARGAYRRARSSETKIRQELKYGQYLSVPKGNREIFSSHDRTKRGRLLAVAIVVAIIAVVALIVLWPK